MVEKPRNGFTLIELLMVIAIILILASLIIPGAHKIIIKAKESSTKAEMVIFSTNLKEYESDNGFYPPSTPDYSSNALMDALKGDPFSNPVKKQYFWFKPKNIRSEGYLSPLGELYYYRENASISPKTHDMHRYDSFDLWTKDGKGNEKGLNNWE
jgi:general secretion pathway protein G